MITFSVQSSGLKNLNAHVNALMRLQNINATIGVEPGIGMKMNASVCVNPRNNGMNVEQVCILFFGAKQFKSTYLVL